MNETRKINEFIPNIGQTNNSNLQVVGGTTQEDLFFSDGLLWWHDDLLSVFVCGAERVGGKGTITNKKLFLDSAAVKDGLVHVQAGPPVRGVPKLSVQWILVDEGALTPTPTLARSKI